MRLFALALGGATIVSLMGHMSMAQAQKSKAAAHEARFERSLKMLEPTERLEQLCDYTAMTNIRKDSKDYRPDRAIAAARAEPRVTGHSIEAKGAVQSGGWSHARLKLTQTDAKSVVVEFLAQSPSPGKVVIMGLLPVSAQVTVKAGHGVTSVRAVADANEVTAQVLR